MNYLSYDVISITLLWQPNRRVANVEDSGSHWKQCPWITFFFRSVKIL